MLCEKCHEREATCHSTTVSDGVASSAAMCKECFASAAESAAPVFFAAAKTARCRYCGGQPCGGVDFSQMLTGGQQMSFMCLQCMNEFGRYCQQQLAHLPQDLPEQEQMAVFRALLVEAERHMTMWNSERGL
jgi:protein-arginine kinase activator protein McsA